ncbi:hypothetical protein FFT88_09460 [Escherichia sp. E4930]|nr:hypothetical protein FFT88_09460 [Escherichia sp. E4930]
MKVGKTLKPLKLKSLLPSSAQRINKFLYTLNNSSRSTCNLKYDEYSAITLNAGLRLVRVFLCPR